MTSPLTLTWKLTRLWPRARYELRGAPERSSGTAFYIGGSRRYYASASILLPDGDHVAMREATAGTMRAAIDRLNAILDKESIGLFGVDAVRFIVEKSA